LPETRNLITCPFMYKIEKIQQKTKINYYILIPHQVFSASVYYSLLGYRSQQWLHLYSVFARRLLATNLNNQSSPASVFTSLLTKRMGHQVTNMDTRNVTFDSFMWMSGNFWANLKRRGRPTRDIHVWN
jgi:hypothetical protein